MRTLIKAIRIAIGWQTCPRCNTFVMPIVIAGNPHQWACPSCQHRNQR